MAVSDEMKQLAERLLREFDRRDSTVSALAFWEKCLPHDEREQSDLAEAFDHNGVARFNEGNAQAALDAFWPNFLLRLGIVKRHPSDRGAIRDFASAEDLMGLACLAIGNVETAEQMLSEALTYRRGLFEDDRADAHAAYLYGVALGHMGKLEHAKGNKESERQFLRQSCEHLTVVDRAWPNVSLIESELADVREQLNALGRT